MKEQLEKYLFRKDAYTYAILDGASVPDLPNVLYEMNPTNVCLYQGELQPDLVYVAPYLVHLLPETPFTDWLLSECWGKHWGIFAQSRYSIQDMRTHFRSLVNVYDEKAVSMIFRFYDSQVMRKFLPTCNAGEVKMFFGKVDTYFAELEDDKNLVRYQIVMVVLKKLNC